MTLVPFSPLALAEWVCLAGLLIAVFTDLRSMRIPNALTVPLMALGLAIHATQGQPMVAFIGLATAFALHFLLFALGVDKAGDAKLMMGVGALLGWQEMVEGTLLSLVTFLPAGLALVLAKGRVHNLLAAVQWTAAKAQGQEAGERPEATFVPKAPFIALGVVLARFVDLV